MKGKTKTIGTKLPICSIALHVGRDFTMSLLKDYATGHLQGNSQTTGDMPMVIHVCSFCLMDNLLTDMLQDLMLLCLVTFM